MRTEVSTPRRQVGVGIGQFVGWMPEGVGPAVGEAVFLLEPARLHPPFAGPPRRSPGPRSATRTRERGSGAPGCSEPAPGRLTCISAEPRKGAVSPNPERPRPSRPVATDARGLVEDGTESAVDLGRGADEHRFGRRRRRRGNGPSRPPPRPGTGFSKAVLAASKTVAAPPESALSSREGRGAVGAAVAAAAEKECGETAGVQAAVHFT